MNKLKIKISEVVKDFSVYPRHKVDDYHVKEMVEALKSGTVFPEIIVDKKSKRLIDGFHRLDAMQKFHDEDVEVKCQYIDCPDEASLFLLAMKYNANHGRYLTKWDKIRCIQISKKIGIPQRKLIDVLHITKDYIDTNLMKRTSISGQPLKRSLIHLSGKELTTEQKDFNDNGCSGMDQLFHINQLIRLIETDSLDLSRPKIEAALERLYTLLGAVVRVSVA